MLRRFETEEPERSVPVRKRSNLKMLNLSLCLCFCTACCSLNSWASVRVEGRWVMKMAGHMGWVSSSSVYQPTWLLLWQACPRQDHRLGPPVGLQRGLASLPEPIKASPMFHLCLSGPHPALQASAPRCQRSLSCCSLPWNNFIVFHSFPGCVCNRSVWRQEFYACLFFCRCVTLS